MRKEAKGHRHSHLASGYEPQDFVTTEDACGVAYLGRRASFLLSSPTLPAEEDPDHREGGQDNRHDQVGAAPGAQQSDERRRGSDAKGLAQGAVAEVQAVDHGVQPGLEPLLDEDDLYLNAAYGHKHKAKPGQYEHGNRGRHRLAQGHRRHEQGRDEGHQPRVVSREPDAGRQRHHPKSQEPRRAQHPRLQRRHPHVLLPVGQQHANGREDHHVHHIHTPQLAHNHPGVGGLALVHHFG